VGFQDNVKVLPLFFYLVQSTFDFILFSSNFTGIIDGLSMADEVLLYKYLVESEALAIRVKVNMVL
jgi:hypothetical protein